MNILHLDILDLYLIHSYFYYYNKVIVVIFGNLLHIVLYFDQMMNNPFDYHLFGDFVYMGDYIVDLDLYIGYLYFDFVESNL